MMSERNTPFPIKPTPRVLTQAEREFEFLLVAGEVNAIARLPDGSEKKLNINDARSAVIQEILPHYLKVQLDPELQKLHKEKRANHQVIDAESPIIADVYDYGLEWKKYQELPKEQKAAQLEKLQKRAKDELELEAHKEQMIVPSTNTAQAKKTPEEPIKREAVLKAIMKATTKRHPALLDELVGHIKVYHRNQELFQAASQDVENKLTGLMKRDSSLSDVQKAAIRQEASVGYEQVFGTPTMLHASAPSMLDDTQDSFKERIIKKKQEQDLLKPLQINALPFSSDAQAAAGHGLPMLLNRGPKSMG